MSPSDTTAVATSVAGSVAANANNFIVCPVEQPRRTDLGVHVLRIETNTCEASNCDAWPLDDQRQDQQRARNGRSILTTIWLVKRAAYGVAEVAAAVVDEASPSSQELKDLGEPTAAESRVTNESEVIVQSTCKWSSLLKPATMRPELFVPTSVAETTLQWKNDKHVKVKGMDGTRHREP
ncbi:hypothetical protein PHYSODRAFT_321268 [Phytophthora sojae]|uniref:Uncharacterized protein n=1 Tax=Phytophthora sojae (strain P6497) TaxID=1094619 RepID=G4YGY1_PHYSP|nr:hypothetical protein PHYSODRAFT_321268 [Phytophthora sojae]EGZ27462.1 hypothetical protein PHYSODRAFT_321268 [Phytophthora sojae]|eukprot:XP_009514737.1 hypothetical protein PHYSODRAFT_321268 [Phytophthora sojae]